MKNIFLYILAVSILFICCAEQGADKKVTEQKIVGINIPVQGMTCGSCEFHVESELKKVNGIVEIKANHEQALAYVKFDSTKLSVDDIVAAINSTGYTATKP